MGRLGDADPPPGASYHTQWLIEHVRAASFDLAFEELAAADWAHVDERPLLARLRDAVAEEMTSQAEASMFALLPLSLHTIGLTSLTAKTMTLDDDNVIHLVREREPVDDAMGVRMHTACGQQLWSDIESPLDACMRGGWQQPEEDTVRCPGCSEHAAEFPETAERPDGPDMPDARVDALAATVAAETRADVAHQLERLRHIQPAAAQEAVTNNYQQWLQETLSVQAHEAGEPVIRDILLRYYDQARNDLAGCGPLAGDELAPLVTVDDWRAAVGNVIEDISASEDGAVARTYLYTELRAVIAERIRRYRASGLSS